MASLDETRPDLLLEPVENQSAGGGQWLTRWRIRNLGNLPVRLLAAWLPHGGFRGEEQKLSSLPLLSQGEDSLLTLSVRCDAPPGGEVENAFLILKVESGHEPWRIFARLRIMVETASSLTAECEQVTVQRIGRLG